MSLLIGSLALSLTACDTAEDAYWDGIDDDIELRDIDNGDNSQIPLFNGLETADVTDFDPAYSLSSDEGMDPSSALLTDTARFKSATYLIECTLPASASITKVVDGQTLTFNGLVGLAPEWETGECDQDCQEWVSSCLLARTNISGATVPIYLLGQENLGYEPPLGTVHEATFWGNLFESTEDIYLCKGSGLAVVEATRQGRTCSQGSGFCGFTTYADCISHDRCTMVGPGDDVPSDCKSGNLAQDLPRNSLSTFVAVQ